jgi:hypothetical protein
MRYRNIDIPDRPVLWTQLGLAGLGMIFRETIEELVTDHDDENDHSVNPPMLGLVLHI